MAIKAARNGEWFTEPSLTTNNPYRRLQMAVSSLPNRSDSVPISIPQIDELENVNHGVGAVVWMLYLAIQDGEDADAGGKTARCVYELLEPWHERLGELCGEFEAALAERRQECKAKEEGRSGE